MNEEIGSVTLWRGLYDRPDDPGNWETFIRRYKDWVLQWTKTWLRDSNDSEDVFAEFCKKIYDNVKNGSARKYEPQSNSYRGVLYKILRNICMDFLNQRGAVATTSGGLAIENERWKELATEAFFEGLDDVDEQEASVKQLDEYRQLFRAALIQRRSQTQYDGKSTEIFFRKYHEGIPTDQLDREYGFEYRDGSGRYARRERDRLIKLMGLPVGTEREVKLAEVIVTVLARVYGDVSTESE